MMSPSGITAGKNAKRKKSLCLLGNQNERSFHFKKVGFQKTKIFTIGNRIGQNSWFKKADLSTKKNLSLFSKCLTSSKTCFLIRRYQLEFCFLLIDRQNLSSICHGPVSWLMKRAMPPASDGIPLIRKNLFTEFL